jgi:hypothetical protein
MKPADVRRLRRLADAADRLRRLYSDAASRGLIDQFGIQGHSDLAEALADFVGWQDRRADAAEREAKP